VSIIEFLTAAVGLNRIQVFGLEQLGESFPFPVGEVVEVLQPDVPGIFQRLGLFCILVAKLLCFVKYEYNKKSPEFQFLISWKSTI
jgi:hypothetical protein